jgi:hypothetical protein
MYITQSNYFCFRGMPAQIREIKTEADRIRLSRLLESLQEEPAPPVEPSEQKTIWNLNPLDFKFTKADEPVLNSRIANFKLAYEKNQNKTNTKHDPVSVVPQPARKKRVRVVLVKK